MPSVPGQWSLILLGVISSATLVLMRDAFAHDAVLRMAADADVRAPGAAVTVALCGHWEHDPPCPLAPHHTSAVRDGGEVRLRILFAAEPGSEEEVRSRIEESLNATHWRLVESRRGEVSAHEAEHARRLIAT
jgi:hypothetical protein